MSSELNSLIYHTKYKYDKYQYVSNLNPGLIRLKYAIAFVAWSLVVLGFYYFLNLSIWYWIIFGPFVALVAYYNWLHLFILATFKDFGLKRHLKMVENYWSSGRLEPEVAIFLPTCGENVEAIKAGWLKIKKINYRNYKVYVLDDGADSDLVRLSEELGFTYFSRPNRGEHKKAGNLLYGYSKVEQDLVLILDADFAPDPDILKEMVPYFEDPKLGILQSPQYFPVDEFVLNESNIKYGAAYGVKEFYQFIQTARDRFDAAICVGTSAMYRRSAIMEAGGPPLVDKSEDVRQGLALINAGYKVKYMPVIQAIGTCPENVQTFFKQHIRWSVGSLEMLFDKNFVSSGLTLVQKAIYTLNISYYIREASALVMSSILFVLLYFHYDTIQWQYTLLFIPYLSYQFFQHGLQSIRARFAMAITGIAQIYTYFNAIFSKLVGVNHVWIPTGQKVEGFTKGYISMVATNLAYFYAILIATVVVLVSHPILIFSPRAWMVLFWVGVTLITHGSLAFSNVNIVLNTISEQIQNGNVHVLQVQRWRMQAVSALFIGVVVLFGTGLSISAFRNPTMIAGTLESIGLSNGQNNQLENNLSNQVASQVKLQDQDDSKNLGNSDSSIDQPIPDTKTQIIEVGDSFTLNQSSQEVSLNKVLGLSKFDAINTNFRIRVKKGDSVARVIRRAVFVYDKTFETEMENYSKMFIEANYLPKLANRTLRVGDLVEIRGNEIATLHIQSLSLNTNQKQNWVQLAKNVNFETDLS